MKKNLFAPILAILLLAAGHNVFAQSATNAALRYRDFVTDNTNADRDIEVVSRFLNAIAAGDAVAMRSFVTADYKGYGPGPKDSVDVNGLISSWQEAFRTQQNRKITVAPVTFRVKDGDVKGDWVPVWGDYSFTAGGKEVKINYHFIAKMVNGKIAMGSLYYDRMAMMETLGYKVVPPSN